jgi:transcription antitermination factor NusG
MLQTAEPALPDAPSVDRLAWAVRQRRVDKEDPLRQDIDCNAPWYTVQTTPHSELHLCKHLSALDIECYAPEFPKLRATRPGSVRDRRHHWVFPGYVFFRSSPEQNALAVVRWIPGVLRVLEADGAPALLADAVVRRLRQRIMERALRPPTPRFAPGERVIIQRGPLAPLDAIFDKELDASARVQILVHLMGRELPVSIDPTHLRSMVS